MPEATLTAWRRQIATHLLDVIDEISHAYAFPKSGAEAPCLLVYPGGHADYVTSSETTFGANRVAYSLQFLQASDQEEKRLAAFEAIAETIEGHLETVPWDPMPQSLEIRRVIEPRFVKFPSGTRYFAGQVDIYIDRPDPNC